jgi:hypothetical protein
MTSNDVASALLHKVCFLGPHVGSAIASTTYSFERNFDSSLVWPDLPFDTAASSSHYVEPARSEILGIVDAAGHLMGTRAPKAFSFVNEQVESVLLRRSSAVEGASSASNRAHIGLCLFTNLHLQADGVLVCAEGLVHEAIHQYLYKDERDHGNFCDLDESRRYRSPWSGNRIPLHSFVHASFVWFGLLTLWCQLAQTVTDRNEGSAIAERVGRILFGYTFVRRTIESPAFPLASVQPRIIALIGHIAEVSSAFAFATDMPRTLRELLQSCENGEWIRRLTSNVERVENSWVTTASTEASS